MGRHEIISVSLAVWQFWAYMRGGSDFYYLGRCMRTVFGGLVLPIRTFWIGARPARSTLHIVL